MDYRKHLAAGKINNINNLEKAFGVDVAKAESSFLHDLSLSMMSSFVKGELLDLDDTIIKSRDVAFSYALDLIKGESSDASKDGKIKGKKAKISKVMGEYSQGTLKSSSGEIVKDKDQAIAIAMSEAGMTKKSDEGDDDEEDEDGEAKNKLKGGEADDHSVESLAKKYKVDVEIVEEAINHGIEVESEHTDDESVAREIAMDHIAEDLSYYIKLEEMEEDDDGKKAGDDGVGAEGYDEAGKNADGTTKVSKKDSDDSEEDDEDEEKGEISPFDALMKGKDYGKLTKVQKQVTRNGKTFTKTYYVKQGEEPKGEGKEELVQGHGNLSKYKIKFEDRGDGTYHAHLHDKNGNSLDEKVTVTEDQKKYHETGKWDDAKKKLSGDGNGGQKGGKKPDRVYSSVKRSAGNYHTGNQEDIKEFKEVGDDHPDRGKYLKIIEHDLKYGGVDLSRIKNIASDHQMRVFEYKVPRMTEGKSNGYHEYLHYRITDKDGNKLISLHVPKHSEEHMDNEKKRIDGHWGNAWNQDGKKTREDSHKHVDEIIKKHTGKI